MRRMMLRMTVLKGGGLRMARVGILCKGSVEIGVAVKVLLHRRVRLLTTRALSGHQRRRKARRRIERLAALRRKGIVVLSKDGGVVLALAELHLGHGAGADAGADQIDLALVLKQVRMHVCKGGIQHVLAGRGELLVLIQGHRGVACGGVKGRLARLFCEEGAGIGVMDGVEVVIGGGGVVAHLGKGRGRLVGPLVVIWIELTGLGGKDEALGPGAVTVGASLALIGPGLHGWDRGDLSGDWRGVIGGRSGRRSERGDRLFFTCRATWALFTAECRLIQ